jgi:hypothetical protein
VLEKLTDIAKGIDRLRKAAAAIGEQRYAAICSEMDFASESFDDIPDRHALKTLLARVEVEAGANRPSADFPSLYIATAVRLPFPPTTTCRQAQPAALSLKEKTMDAKRVCASPVLSARDLEIRTDPDLTEIVARFLAVSEGVLAHLIEYARGLLLFITAPGDDRSGKFYVYDRNKGSSWLLTLADAVFGGYPLS